VSGVVVVAVVVDLRQGKEVVSGRVVEVLVVEVEVIILRRRCVRILLRDSVVLGRGVILHMEQWSFVLHEILIFVMMMRKLLLKFC